MADASVSARARSDEGAIRFLVFVCGAALVFGSFGGVLPIISVWFLDLFTFCGRFFVTSKLRVSN